MKLKLNKTFVVLFSVLSLFLHSCSDDDSQNLSVKREIRFQKITLKDIRKTKQDKNGAYSKVLETIQGLKAKSSNSNRDVNINDYYVDENNGSYIENNGTQTFTFPVYDLTTENQNLENLVVTIDSDGDTRSAIVKYDLTEEDLKNNLTPKQVTPIDISGRVMENSNICMVLYCSNDGHGSAGANHVAGENCTNSTFLFYIFVYYNGTNGGVGGTGNNTGTGGTGNGTNAGGGIVTTPVGGTLTEKQITFLRNLDFREEFMQLNYSAIGPVVNYVNTVANINPALTYFNTQANYTWMMQQSDVSQASILNFLIKNNFSSSSVSFLNQLINMAANNGGSFHFDSTLNSSNSLTLNNINELTTHVNSNEVIPNSGFENLEHPTQNNDYVGRYRVKANLLGGVLSYVRFTRANNLYSTDNTKVETSIYGFNPFVEWIPASNMTTLVQNIANGQVKIQIFGKLRQQYTIPGFDGIIFDRFIRIILIIDRESGALESGECITD